MDTNELINRIEGALEHHEENRYFDGPSQDTFEVDDNVVEIRFGNGDRFRLTVEKFG